SDRSEGQKEYQMKGRFSTLAIAAISGLVGALAIGAVVSAGASEDPGVIVGNHTKAAGQGTGNEIDVGGSDANAGGDTTAFGSGNEQSLENDCHKADCSNDAAFGGGSGDPSWSGHKSGGGSGEADALAAVNSSGNSANSNTNTQSSNTQVGVNQATGVDQTSVNVAIAAQEQDQQQQQQQQIVDSGNGTGGEGGSAAAIGQACA